MTLVSCARVMVAVKARLVIVGNAGMFARTMKVIIVKIASRVDGHHWAHNLLEYKRDGFVLKIII